MFRYETLAQNLTLEKKEQNMYIDPNTGGMLFQALAGLLAVISGGLLFFSRQIREGIARLRRRRRKDDEDPTK
jgi:LPXTG-motif cell wall-anchored protein